MASNGWLARDGHHEGGAGAAVAGLALRGTASVAAREARPLDVDGG